MHNKILQKTFNILTQLKDSSDIQGEPGIKLGTPWYKASDLSIAPRQLTFCGCYLEACWVYVFVASCPGHLKAQQAVVLV